MNRADRRRFKKYGNTTGEIATPNLNDFIHLYSLSFILALDSCEISKDKVMEIMEKVEENAECMLSGHINQTDVETMAESIYGIKFIEGIRNNICVLDGKLIRTK